jgi:leucyl aminopeptidase
MITKTTVATLSETTVAFFAVPVTFREGVGSIAADIPDEVASLRVPRTLSEEWCATHGLAPKAGSSVILATLDGPSIVLVSLGESPDAESYRLAAAAAVRAARGKDLAFVLATSALDAVADVAQAVVEAAILTSYSYKKPDDEANLFVVPLGQPLPSIEAHDAIVTGVERGVIIANATNWAKRLVDSPPNVMTPKQLAKAIASRLANVANVEIEVWTESKIRDERLGGVLAVSSGSAEPARVVIGTYTPDHAKAHYALIGKGVTFDSGGLAIKPLPGMYEMKTDMSGAAVVSGVLAAVSALKLPIRLTVIAPLVENMSGDQAVKPSDVITSRSGITIEVANPDAEGRLILAEGMTLALEQNPDAMIDVATLTGAMSAALGNECAGFFSSDSALTEAIMNASAASGEGFWPMPLDGRYEKDIESETADLKNMGKFGGGPGAITAALFLQHFNDGRPWAHFDIAGPARAGESRGYYQRGGTAWGLRTIVALLTRVASVE